MNKIFTVTTILITGLLLMSGCVPTASGAITPNPENLVTNTVGGQAELSVTKAAPTATQAAPTVTPAGQATVTQETTTQPGTPQGQGMQIGSTPKLFSIAMQDENTGWGLSEKQVYRTSDGGSNWKDITPTDIISSSQALRGFFLNDRDGWVIAPEAENFTAGLLYQTGDGGATWQSSRVPFGAGQLYFIDPKNGWVLFVTGAAAGSATADVFQTRDGGASWTKVYSIDPQKPDEPGGLPLSGMKSGLSFVNETRGWVTGSIPMDNYVWLFKTEDGGKTWQQQDLALPEGTSTAMLSLDPPRFFSGQDGILPVTIYAGDVSKDFYVTHDGGMTWKTSTPVASNGIYDFISAQTGWVWDGKTLRSTKDGGQTWSDIKTNVDLSQVLAQLDFVSETTGWALAMDADGKVQLYKTTDAGATWNPTFH